MTKPARYYTAGDRANLYLKHPQGHSTYVPPREIPALLNAPLRLAFRRMLSRFSAKR